MSKRLNLERISFEEYNRLCGLVDVPKDNSPYMLFGNHYRPNVHAVIKESSQADSTQTDNQAVNFRLRYKDLNEVVEYIEDDTLSVVCVHPVGQWGIGQSEHRTLNERESYLRQLKELHGVGTYVVRVAKKGNRRMLHNHKEIMRDVFSFRNVGRGLILSRVNIHNDRFSLYDFGELNGYIKGGQIQIPSIRALNPELR